MVTSVIISKIFFHSNVIFLVQQTECTVRNGSSIIDLSPLIHRTGGYEAYDESEEDTSDTNPDFYINICQPLNPMHGVPCPAGAAVCKIPVTGPPLVSVESSKNSGKNFCTTCCVSCVQWRVHRIEK